MGWRENMDAMQEQCGPEDMYEDRCPHCGGSGERPVLRNDGVNDYVPCEHTSPIAPPPYLNGPARRILERLADAVGSMQRETGPDEASAIRRECLPLFEQLGIMETGEGLGFDEDDFADSSE